MLEVAWDWVWKREKSKNNVSVNDTRVEFVLKLIWWVLEFTYWGVEQDAQVWVHQVLVQGDQQQMTLGLQCGPATQRDSAPDENSLDQQEGASEED